VSALVCQDKLLETELTQVSPFGLWRLQSASHYTELVESDLELILNYPRCSGPGQLVMGYPSSASLFVLLEPCGKRKRILLLSESNACSLSPIRHEDLQKKG
jgi:hypothetical protein